MATPKRKPATQAIGRSVKTSITLDADTYVRLQTLAAMRNTSANAIINEALAVALAGVVAYQRATPPVAEPTSGG
jgi:lysozyme family protein